jgi:predicted RNase H-like nuclease
MVGLFSLPYTLPYKGKKGRDLAGLQAAYEVLLDSMERHLLELALPRNDRWAQLRTTAANPQRKADLERIEDEIDAIVCAHLAWLWSNRPGVLQVYGDVTTGYIVAPPPPEHPPMRRPARTVRTQARTGMRGAAGPAVVSKDAGDLETLALDMVKVVPKLSPDEARVLAERARRHFER